MAIVITNHLANGPEFIVAVPYPAAQWPVLPFAISHHLQKSPEFIVAMPRPTRADPVIPIDTVNRWPTPGAGTTSGRPIYS